MAGLQACGATPVWPRPVAGKASFQPQLPAPRRASAWRRWRKRLPLAAAGPAALLLTLGAGLALAAWQGLKDKPPPPRPAFAPGDHHEGEPLPPMHPLLRKAQWQSDATDGAGRAGATLPAAPASAAAAAPGSPPLTLRRACVWGKPGRNPYRGTVEQALDTASLPPEVVREIARQVRAGTPADALQISNAGIVARDSGRRFSASNVAMTYGMTLCLGTKVNFVAGHTEPGALYEAADHAGRIYAVMVPEVCGNVSVLGETADGDPRLQHTGGDGADDRVRLMPMQLDWNPTQSAGVHRATQRVSAPGTLVLVLAGLALLRLGRWRRQLEPARPQSQAGEDRSP
jgi:hypothetical protein